MRVPHHRLVAAVVLLTAGAAGGLAGCTGPTGGPGPVPASPLPSWAWEMPRCVAYVPEQYAAPAHRISATVEQVAAGSSVTEVYEPGWGPRAVDEIRAVVRTCGSFEHGRVREQHLVVPTTFPSDESLLVETVRLAPPAPARTGYVAVVRSGDVVVTVRTSEREPGEVLCLASAAAEAGAGAGAGGHGSAEPAAGPATCPSPQA